MRRLRINGTSFIVTRVKNNHKDVIDNGFGTVPYGIIPLPSTLVEKILYS